MLGVFDGFMHIESNINIINVFIDKTNVYNMYEIKLLKTLKRMWPGFKKLIIDYISHK